MFFTYKSFTDSEVVMLSKQQPHDWFSGTTQIPKISIFCDSHPKMIMFTADPFR